jgi:hypothetical protein
MGTSKITGMGDPTNNQDAATKVYVDTQRDTRLALAGGTMTGNITMGTNKVTGLGVPTDANDAATKTYVDTADATKLNLSGGTMTGAIAMGTSKITGLGDPSNTQDAATKNYVDTQDATKLSLSGGTMTGAIAMGTNRITGMGDPVGNQDAATKFYIDTLFGSTTSAAASAAAASVSASNAANSEANALTYSNNASNSASAALTSENNAAASFDSFDDRYLGSKSSPPSVDNDGNALLTGALYWNSVSNQLFVWDGAAWDQAAFNISGGLTTGDIGVSVQAYDAGLQSISGLTTAADKMIYTTALDTYAVTDLTSAGRALLDDADAAAQRTTLGLTALATTTPGTNVATFLATPSSANLAAAITDETGTGALVFANTPTLVTPTLGAATATSINKVAFTAPATSATLTIADGKTLTANNSLTLAGTDATTMTFPSTSQTIAGLGLAQTFTQAQTFRAANAIRSEAASTQDAIVIAGRAGGTSSYAVTVAPTTLSANRTLTLPDNAGTVLTTGATVTVSQGGTGATTFTANNVLLGNGTSAFQVVAPGTTGNVLTSNGTTWTSAAPTGGGITTGKAIAMAIVFG